MGFFHRNDNKASIKPCLSPSYNWVIPHHFNTYYRRLDPICLYPVIDLFVNSLSINNETIFLIIAHKKE